MVIDSNRELSPIATSNIELGLSELIRPKHKAEVLPIAQNLRLELLTNIGKYWVFKMQYHQSISKQLLAIKGVYWNDNYKCYMAFRHPDVKKKVEQLLETPSFLGEDFLSKERTFRGEKVSLKWSDILLQKHKIHIKNAKGMKDRMVMFPYSIVHSLELYKKLYKGNHYVFEGQFAVNLIVQVAYNQ